MFSVGGMTCSACVATIESYVGSQPGIVSVSVGLIQERAEVRYDPAQVKLLDIIEHIESVGFEAKHLEEVCAFICMGLNLHVNRRKTTNYALT